MINIPKKVAQPVEDSSEMPRAVAEIPQEVEAPEVIPYVISFVKYNEKMCGISELNGSKSRKAIKIFKTVGTKIRSEADFQRYSIDRIPVFRKGEYKKLYRGLGEDINLKEIKLQPPARIFYFDVESKRTFYVVAVTQRHLETDKVRR